jgi:lipopolysaccharide export system protein LptC
LADLMTEYADQPAPRRIRFDPTRVRDERLYSRAYSHSRWVRRLKFILPAIAVAAVVGFFLTMRVVTGTGEAVISNAGINVAKKSLEMKAPHISGFTGTQQSYELKALRALQDLDNPKVVRLEKIDGHFGIGKGQTATISAATGIYDGARNLLRLTDGIELSTTDGYQAVFADADVDIAKGHLETDKPMEIHADSGTLKGSIRANRLVVEDHGKHVTFSGGVSVLFTPPDDPPANGPAAASPPATDGDALDSAADRLKSITE